MVSLAFLLAGIGLSLATRVATGNGTSIEPRLAASPHAFARELVRFRQATGRAPAPEEFRAIQRSVLDEAVLVHHALRLRLDLGDPVVESRLVRNATFLLRSSPGTATDNQSAEAPAGRATESAVESANESAAQTRAPFRSEALAFARRMGMQHTDPVVRRRLAQVVEEQLSVEQLSAQQPASAEDVRSWIRRNPQQFTRPATVTLEHVFFAADDSETRTRITDTLAGLRTGTTQPKTAGDAFLLGRRLGPVSLENLSARFGPAFVGSLRGLQEGRWEGPVESPWGKHLVHILQRRDSQPYGDDVAIPRARAALRDARRQQEFRQNLARLHALYRPYLPEAQTTPGAAR